MSFDKARRDFLTRGLLRGVKKMMGGSGESSEESGGPSCDYFASFETCYPLLADAGSLLEEEAARLGIDIKGRTREDIAREIFSRLE